MLKRHNIFSNIIEAKNGMEAIEAIKNNKVDILLLDIIMPVMDGIETLKVIRSDENMKDIPVIVLTTDDTKKGKAFEAGANEFIFKPIKENEVIQKIEKLLNVS
jgi:putative two-component system response regulator